MPLPKSFFGDYINESQFLIDYVLQSDWLINMGKENSNWPPKMKKFRERFSLSNSDISFTDRIRILSLDIIVDNVRNLLNDEPLKKKKLEICTYLMAGLSDGYGAVKRYYEEVQRRNNFFKNQNL